jgi:hypothetical protein
MGAVKTVKNAKASVYQISGAQKGLTEDVRGRQRRYVISMSIRAVCFVLGIVINHPVRWVFFAGALLLPYVAVVIANGGRERRTNEPVASQVVPPASMKAIEPPIGAVLTGAEQRTMRGESSVVDEETLARDAGPEGHTTWVAGESGTSPAEPPARPSDHVE